MNPRQVQTKTAMAEEFAELFHECQEEYRALLEAIRDGDVGIRDFDSRAYVLYCDMLRLKQMRVQIDKLKQQEALE